MSRSMTWNCVGGVRLTAKDENGQITTTTYNDPDFWRLASISFPDGGQTSWTYNSQTSTATTKKMNSSQNIVSTQLLDGLGRNKEQQLNSDPEGVVYTDTTYDKLGRIYNVSNPYRSTSDPTYGLTTNAYDALSRPTSVTLQDGSITSTSYTTNSITATDPAGKKRQGTTDSLGRLTQVTEDPGGLGYITTYTYDALGDLTGVTQNGRAQRTYAYDDLSRLTSETNPESGTVTYGYDASGHQGDLTSRVAPAPNQTGSSTVTTTYAYDLLHRLTQKSYSDGTTPAANFVYDQTANWFSLTNTAGRMTEAYSQIPGLVGTVFSYDSTGRVIVNNQCDPAECPSGGMPLTYTYDLAGDMTSYSNGVGITFTQLFDSAGRATSLTSSLVDSQHPATLATADSSVGYYPHGALRKMTFGNNLSQTAAFNKTLEPCRINANSAGTALGTCTDAIPPGNIQDLNYGFNFGSTNNGNIATWTATGTQNFSRTYSYDPLNRVSILSSPSDPNGCTGLSWTYDAWGNRTDQTVTGGTCPGFHQTINTQNRLANSPYAYDSAGNLTADGSHTYFYDAENRLSQVGGTFGTCSTATACYSYDALGRRVEKVTGSTKLDYLFDLSGNAVTEWCTNCGGYTGPTAEYILLSGNLVAEYKNSTTYFVHKDHLGSARLVTGLTQNIAQNLDYLPFGELNSSDSGITTHKFTGDERDSETNLEHTWFRQHSSALGRWTTPDPAGLAAVDPTNPQSWNRYAYVRNNPLLLTDALGLTTCDANGNNCYDSVTVNGDTGTVSWADGGGTASWPCSGFVSIQCGPLPLPRVNKLISLLRKIGNYIPTVCGTGGFTYAGGRGSGGIASVGLYNISSSDSRTGHASGPFTDITVGELIQGGYGYATYSDGSTEHFGFAGVGGDVGVASANVSQYVSHVSGDSLLRNQFGLNIDFGGPLTGAGAGFGLNTDSMTSCFDHNFH